MRASNGPEPAGDEPDDAAPDEVAPLSDLDAPASRDDLVNRAWEFEAPSANSDSAADEADSDTSTGADRCDDDAEPPTHEADASTQGASDPAATVTTTTPAESAGPGDGSDATTTTTSGAARQSHERRTRPRYGRPGRPLRRNSPFYIGFVAGLGVLLAYHLAKSAVSITGDLVLIAVSMFLAIGLNSFVDMLTRRGMNRGLAVLVVALSSMLLFFGVIAAIVPPLVNQTTSLIHNLPNRLTHLENNPTVQRLDRKYHIIDKVKSDLISASTGSTLGGALLGFGKFLVSSVFKAFTSLVLTLYFLGSLPTIKRTAYEMLPRSRRARVALLGDEVLNRIGGYLSGALLVATCAGLSTWLVLGVLGVPYALPLSLVIGATDLVPLVGATIGAVLVTAIVLISSVTDALVCGIFFIAYQQLENYFIYPRVMAKTVKVPAALAVIAALIGAGLLGVVGALLAIPLAAGAMFLVQEVIIPRQDKS
jgi:predicted PurR-regulated permease PerM